ncbi:MAG TPA: hypothetical protein VGO01_04035 [Bradyrhizobium sp.]|jgi:hypothetical protein|nr:hypothetical protein [Bradyrhizobium sp.]
MDGERTIAAKTRPRKRSAAEVAPAAEMPAAMAAEMATTVKMPSASVTTSTVATAAVATAAVATAATFRSSIARGRQRGRKNKDGNSHLEF